MRKENLENVTSYLEKSIAELTSAGIEDEKIMSRYIEYKVALELAKRQHVVQISNERRQKGADIYLSEENIRVEVKSGKYDGWSCASFRNGEQIVKGKFDYCVFVPYLDNVPDEFLVFSRKELAEVSGRKMKKFAHHPTTNPCMLVRCDSYDDLKSLLDDSGERILNVEEELHKHPERFKDKWNKIK
jgi:hypothetical protein